MKERLTGAIILVAVIVLLVPELLSGPKGRSASTPAAPVTGATEEPPLRSYTINLGEESHSKAATADTNGPAMPQPERSEGNPEKRQGRDAGQAGSEQPAMPADEGEPQQPAAAFNTPERATPATGGPQAGAPPPSTGSPAETAPLPKPNPAPAHAAVPRESKPSAHAPAPEPKPPAAKAPTHSKPANAPKPPSSAALASNSSAAKPNKAPAAAAKSESAKSESGWAVQLGVFSSHENAERLAIEVRVKGFKASVSPVTSGSRKLYRVRVGPTPDRAGAQELQTRLKAAGRPGGAIVPYS